MSIEQNEYTTNNLVKKNPDQINSNYESRLLRAVAPNIGGVSLEGTYPLQGKFVCHLRYITLIRNVC